MAARSSSSQTKPHLGVKSFDTTSRNSAVNVTAASHGAAQILASLLIQAEAFERCGDWIEIVALLEAKSSLLEEFSSRSESAGADESWIWLSIESIYIRALIFVGEFELARVRNSNLKIQMQILRSKSNQMEKDAIKMHRARYLITQSAWARSQNDFRRGYGFAALARKSLSKLSFLYAEAQFAMALSLSFLERAYEALALYAGIQRLGSATDHRKMLSASNEAHERMSASDIEGSRALIPKMPTARQLRLSLQVAMIEGCEDQILNSMSNETLESLPPTERLYVLILMGESFLAKQRLEFKNFAVAVDELKKFSLKNSSPFVSKLLEIWSSVITGAIEGAQDALGDFESVTVKDQLDLRFHRLLALASLGRDVRSEYAQLTQDLIQARMIHPLLPQLSQLEQPRFAWHAKLARKFGFSGELYNELELNLSTKIVANGARRVSFAKHGKSLELLLALAEGGPVLEKAWLHQKISGNRYSPQLHDTRLRMLLNRLKEKLKKDFEIELFEMPGDNRIHLKTRISVSKTDERGS